MTRPTSEQVLAMASDPAAARAGQGLASARHWALLGTTDAALWGLCQGSGREPYRARVALPDLAAQCSCPSRKLPCKHTLGLLLLFAQGAVPPGEPPAFVLEWLEGRAARTARKTSRAAAAPAHPEAAARQAAARDAQREARVSEGLEDLRAWIEDLVGAGFAHAPVRDPAFWEARARRLVDAQAPGLARQVGDLARVPHGGADWPARLLARLARLHLVAEAYAHRERLAPDALADLHRVIGRPQRKEDAAASAAVDDRWLCTGEWLLETDGLQTQRTWLYGRSTGRFALLLAFAPEGQPLPPVMQVGAESRAQLAYFPASVPLRATMAGRETDGDRPGTPPPGSTIAGALEQIAEVRARDPWVTPLPLLVSATLRRDRVDRWWLIDASGDGLPLASGSPRPPWEWMAVTGGARCTWFGEWTGEDVRPLHTWPEDRTP